MSERHWLTRGRDPADYTLFAGTELDVELQKKGHWCCNIHHLGNPVMRVERRRNKPRPDGTVYGHKLEPGGGPVDVSAWFPEDGKTCANCGWSKAVTGHLCPKACIRLPEHERPDWKPRKNRPTGTHAELILVDEFAHNQPSIPGAGEGGRTMKKYRIDVVEKRTVVGEQGGQPIREVLMGFSTVASSERGAILKAGAAIGEKLAEYAEERLVFAVDAIPFME